ncbi:glycosyltransferase [Kushneria sp. Sum13]|uniref:glycosyltransferase n=1 Tax=Kushneria sp. Sum13 TaxID=3459196 RepID=UPI0040466725
MSTAKTLTCGICIPTCNAGRDWKDYLEKTSAASAGMRLLIIDSTSDDSTASIAQKDGCELVTIPRHEFDHGGTRNRALQLLDDCDVIIFMTQDAYPATTSTLQKLVSVFEDSDMGAAYGRQLPHENASAVAAHARLFNYPADSHRVSVDDIPQMGIKAAFLSNSFAAYRRQALMDIGGFPENAILSEDMVAGARLLNAGWQMAYCAEAEVHHSHNYTMLQECRRYFDIGVLHAREAWIQEMTGRAEGEGKRFVVSELRYLWRRSPLTIPSAICRNALKYIGYRLGKMEGHLPTGLKRQLSMNKGFWGR